MAYDRLRQIQPLYFSYHEVAEFMGIQLDSARVLCSRSFSKGLLVRIKRNFYVLRERWERLTTEEFFQLANVIQTPSYISLTTALFYHGYTTQLQRGFIESICVTRTYYKSISGIDFNFSKIANQLYGYFEKRNGFFIASPEKALVDALYLTSLGNYSLDFSALEITKFDYDAIENLLNVYPPKTKTLWSRHEGI